MTGEEKFWAKINKEGLGGCWLWMGATTGKSGYGRIYVQRRMVLAHRFAYELTTGPIPAGMDLDHLCRTRLCVNPAHLEPVTHHENVLRGEGGAHHAAKTHCPKGHPYSPENTLVWRGIRNCKACRAQHQASFKKRNPHYQRDWWRINRGKSA
jgi:hypothetical protein